jgi:hypothetical protein
LKQRERRERSPEGERGRDDEGEGRGIEREGIGEERKRGIWSSRGGMDEWLKKRTRTAVPTEDGTQ